MKTKFTNKNYNKPISHRMLVASNTGTRVMKSKKDKENTRQALKLKLRTEW